jgi:hypothetical protein
MTMVGARRALAAALVALALGACSASVSVGGKNLDTAKLEDRISAEIDKQLNVKTDVSCPRNVKIKEGDTFECTAKADDGSTRQVQVTQKDDEGNVHFELV